MSRFLQKSLNSSAGDHTIWTSPQMRSEGFLFMSAGLGVELCLPTVVLRAPPFASTPPFPTVRMKEKINSYGGAAKSVFGSQRCCGVAFYVAGAILC